MSAALLLLAVLCGTDPWALVERSETSRDVPMEAVVRTTVWMAGSAEEARTMRFRLRQDKGFLQIEPLDKKGKGFKEHNGQIEGHGRPAMPMPPQLPDDVALDLARRNYEAVIERTDSISGRLCQVIRLRPRHPGGNGRRLWIDPLTGLALRRDQYNEKGELQRSATMESVQHLKELPKDEPPRAPMAGAPGGNREMPPPPGPCVTSLSSPALTSAQAKEWLGFEVPEARWIPEGFVLVGIHSQTCPEGGHALQMGWSDGLAQFSVFVHPDGCMRPMEPRRRGFFQRIGSWMHSKRGGMHPPVVIAKLGTRAEVVALGDMPRPLLSRVLLSMTSREAPIRILSGIPEPPDRRDP